MDTLETKRQELYQSVDAAKVVVGSQDWILSLDDVTDKGVSYANTIGNVRRNTENLETVELFTSKISHRPDIMQKTRGVFLRSIGHGVFTREDGDPLFFAIPTLTMDDDPLEIFNISLTRVNWTVNKQDNFWRLFNRSEDGFKTSFRGSNYLALNFDEPQKFTHIFIKPLEGETSSIGIAINNLSPRFIYRNYSLHDSPEGVLIEIPQDKIDAGIFNIRIGAGSDWSSGTAGSIRQLALAQFDLLISE